MQKQVRYKRCALLLLLVLATHTVFGANVNDIKRKQGNIRQDINETKQRLKETQQNLGQNKEEQKDVLKEIQNLDQKTEKAQAEVNHTRNTLLQVSQSLKKIENQLEKAEEEQKRNYDGLKQSIKISYENRGTGYLQLLLEADSFGNFLRRMDVVSSIISHNDRIFKIAIEKQKEIEEKKKKIELQKKSIQLLHHQQLAQKENLQKMQEQKQEYMGILQNKEKQYAKQEQHFENELDALEATERQLTAEIQRILSSGNKKPTPYVGGKLGWPVPGQYNITSSFGYRIHPVKKTKKLHAGIDIGVATGTRVVAAGQGTVIISQWYGGYGNLVAVDHGGGIVTMYAHNSSLSVSVGQKVKKGQQVALSGNTGLSTGPHVHFEVKQGGVAVDPMGYLK